MSWITCPFFEDIAVEIPEGEVRDVQMHDGSHLRIRKLQREYDPTNKLAALSAAGGGGGEGRSPYRCVICEHH